MKLNHVKGQVCLVEATTNAVKELEKSYSYILKERIEEYGVDSLLDEEILSLLTGISIDVIRKAIDDFGLPELYKYSGSLNLTKAQIRKLELLTMYYKRISVSTHKEKSVLNSSSKAGEYALSLYIGKTYECFYVICLDSQNRVNYSALVHEGTINEAPVYPRLIVEVALNYKANSVILSHLHPGGSLSPSQADLDVTKKIRQALEPISIKIMDHIIVGDGKFMSFAEKGLL